MKYLILLFFSFLFLDSKGQNMDDFIGSVMKMRNGVVICKPYDYSCKKIEIYNNTNEYLVFSYIVVPSDILQDTVKASALHEKAKKQSCFINPRTKIVRMNGFSLFPSCGDTFNDKLSNLLLDDFEKICSGYK